MSGAVDFVSEKVFKPVRNFVKKVWDNKVLRAVIIAAAVVYTAGVASGAWTWSLEAVPAATTYTSVAAETAAVAGTSNVTVGAIAADSATAAEIAGTSMAAPATAPVAGAAAAPTVGAAGMTGSEVAGATAFDAAETAAYEASLSSVPESAGLVEGAMNAVGSTGKWMADNPMATMMIGSGISNASAEREARKTAEAQRQHEIDMAANVGVGGFNNMGAYSAPANVAPGVVNSAAGQPIQLTGNATAARPIQRSNLPQLQKQGLIAGQPIQLRG